MLSSAFHSSHPATRLSRRATAAPGSGRIHLWAHSPSHHGLTTQQLYSKPGTTGTSHSRSLVVGAATPAGAPASAVAAAAPQITMDVVDRVRGCLWGILIADSLSMPVHWYYNPNDIVKDFNGIKGYQAPRTRHPSSIMSLSNTGGHGRGGQQGRIIGDVINHGKHDFWGKSGVHYHQGMKAGENTLNALCARVVMRSMATTGKYDASAVLADYVKFMTTPGSHNDTYAESFHRDFFKNWAAGVPPERCSQGTEGHNTAQIGGFVMLPPVVMGSLPSGRDAAVRAAITQLELTHESKSLAAYAEVYADLLFRLASGATTLRPALEGVAQQSLRLDLPKLLGQRYDDVRVIHSVFGSACYIDDSFPSMLYLAYKYADDFAGGVLANTNVGGENCHRGSALGALLGVAVGESKIPKELIEGLHDHANIKKEIDAFVTALLPSEAGVAAGAAAGSCSAAGGQQ